MPGQARGFPGGYDECTASGTAQPRDLRSHDGVQGRRPRTTEAAGGNLRRSAERERVNSERMPSDSTPPISARLTPVSGLDHLQYSESAAVALLTINRPAVHNAISLATMDELDRVFGWLETGSQVGVLVLTGAGSRVFVSGGDLKDFEQLNTYESAVAMSRRMQLLMARMHQLPLPVIGAINGDCLGGGCGGAPATDIRISGDAAHFGFQPVTLGITPRC